MSGSSWVYLKSKGEELWTVGFYKPDGKWEPESDHGTSEEAAARVHYLNGGHPPVNPYLLSADDLWELSHGKRS